MKRFFLALLTSSIVVCCSDDPSKESKAIQFSATELSITEGDKLEIDIILEKAITQNDTIFLSISNISADHSDYTISPGTEDNLVKVAGVSGMTTLQVSVDAERDSEGESTETFSVEIVDVPNRYYVADQNVIIINIQNNALTDGLIGEFLFNGNADDTSPEFSNHAIVHGATLTSDRKGNINSAYIFDGINDYIEIPHTSLFNFSNHQDFSISLWLLANTTQNDMTGGGNEIITKWDNGTSGYPFSMRYINGMSNPGLAGSFQASRYNSSTCADQPLVFTPVFALDMYRHVVYTKNGLSLKIYVDNVLTNEFNDFGENECSTTNSHSISVGTRGNGIYFFTGKIDDIRFYNRALTTENITALFNE
jgi:hypothetical protein